MTAETYDNLKQYVGSKDDFTDDLLNMGYTKGRMEGIKDGIEKYIAELMKHASKDEYPVICMDEFTLKRIAEKVLERKVI